MSRWENRLNRRNRKIVSRITAAGGTFIPRGLVGVKTFRSMWPSGDHTRRLARFTGPDALKAHLEKGTWRAMGDKLKANFFNPSKLTNIQSTTKLGTFKRAGMFGRTFAELKSAPRIAAAVAARQGISTKSSLILGGALGAAALGSIAYRNRSAIRQKIGELKAKYGSWRDQPRDEQGQWA